MNEVLGLLLWNVSLAALATLFYVAVSRSHVSKSLDRKSQTLVAWLLIGGGMLGLLPTLMLLNLFAGAEVLMALAPPMITIALSAIVVVKVPVPAGRATDDQGEHNAP
jgi:hypothetical protein